MKPTTEQLLEHALYLLSMSEPDPLLIDEDEYWEEFEELMDGVYPNDKPKAPQVYESSSGVIDLNQRRLLKEANENLGNIVEVLFDLGQILGERTTIAQNDPTITLSQDEAAFDTKDIFLKGKRGDSDTTSIIGLHAIGYAAYNDYMLIKDDDPKKHVSSNFQAVETWGSEYDSEGNAIGERFPLRSFDIEEYARDMEDEGWERHERPKK